MACVALYSVWRDLDKDGKTDTGELKTLTESGITSISLTTTTPASSQLAGNPITAQSTVTFANGQSHVIADVILANKQADSVYLGDNTDFFDLTRDANIEDPTSFFFVAANDNHLIKPSKRTAA